MKKNKEEIRKYPGEFVNDELTEMIRIGARKILEEALNVEMQEYMRYYSNLRLPGAKHRVVRNGYLPEREIMTAIGGVKVRVPRSRDKAVEKKVESFSSKLIPPYLKRSKKMEEFIPYLYLRGISTGEMKDCLSVLVGKSCKSFSSSLVSNLKKKWKEEHQEFKKRDLSETEYAYLWVDGIYSNVRMGEKQCLLVIIGATHEGKKELLAVEAGYRESAQSWREVLLNLKARGMNPPKLAIGDGAMGFWKAVNEIFPKTKHQRCWVHKTANVLNKLPKKLQPKAKESLHQIWMAENQKDASKAFDLFVQKYEDKYPASVTCLEKDREELLRFYDFPAKHWIHIRTTNPIESTFATVRLRTKKVRGCFSEETTEMMAFKLCQAAEKTWRKLRGSELMPKVIDNIPFKDGIEVTEETLVA